MIDEEKLLERFAELDYPITYPDGSHGRGMGYGDFENLIKSMIKEQKKGASEK